MPVLDNAYILNVTATDPQGNAKAQTVTVNVTNVNESPIFTSPAAFNVAENTTAVGTVAATDPDSGAVIAYSIVGGTDSTKFAINSTTGALTFVAAPNYEAPDDANADRVYNVTVRASDGTNTVDQAIAVTLTNVNEAPTITTAAAIGANENSTAVATIGATDQDAGAVITYTITGGADAAKFALTSGGVLTFVTAPDYDAPTDANGDNVYEVVVTVSDGALTNARAFSVTVANANEAPAFTSSDAFTVSENTTTVGTAAAVDPEGGAVTYSITGGVDSAKFDINPSTGAITFKVAPDFEAPTDA